MLRNGQLCTGYHSSNFTAANILGEMDKVFAGVAALRNHAQARSRFYIGYEAYAFFQQAQAAQNTGAGYNQDLSAASYLGYPVYPTAGIGTADAIAFTYPDNIVVGTNAYTGNEAAALIPCISTTVATT